MTITDEVISTNTEKFNTLTFTRQYHVIQISALAVEDSISIFLLYINLKILSGSYKVSQLSPLNSMNQNHLADSYPQASNKYLEIG